MTEFIYSVDFSILELIRENLRCGFLDIFLGIMTFLGNGGMVWALIAAALLFFRKHRFTGIMMAAALIICLLVGEIAIKSLVARERPFIQNPSVTVSISPPTGYSFPSGHTLSSFSAAAVIFLRSRKRRAVGIAAVISAFLIGFSRLYFYVHFPTDVLCGMILGIINGAAVFAVLRRFEHRKEEEVKEST